MENLSKNKLQPIADVIDINNSLVFLNKPPKIINHELTTWVKKITGAKRAGHAGTLDPEVSGVVPIALGNATKLLQYIASENKTYVGIIKFKNILPRKQIESLFAQFVGELIQTPPKISAVKKAPRKRTVHYLKFLEQKDRLVLFEAKVDAGTYIRTLCEDIGKLCGGARMEELRRIAVGSITEAECITIYDLIDAMYFYKNNKPQMLKNILKKPQDYIFYPKVFIKKSALASILNGAQIMKPAIIKMEHTDIGKRVCIYCDDLFVGVGICKVNDINSKDTDIFIKLERMHLDKNYLSDRQI